MYKKTKFDLDRRENSVYWDPEWKKSGNKLHGRDLHSPSTFLVHYHVI